MAWLGAPLAVNEAQGLGEQKAIVNRIRFAIRLCDKYAPWPTECYTRSLTGKIMLGRRKIPGTLFFGFTTGRSAGRKGHAWLQSAGTIVTGFCDFSQYEVHSTFK